MSFRSDTETGYKHTTADNSMKKNKLKDSGDPHDYSKAHHPAPKPSAQKDSLPVTFAFQNPIQYTIRSAYSTFLLLCMHDSLYACTKAEVCRTLTERSEYISTTSCLTARCSCILQIAFCATKKEPALTSSFLKSIHSVFQNPEIVFPCLLFEEIRNLDRLLFYIA